MKVAVVWNNGMGQVVNRFGRPCPEKYGHTAVERVVDGLREGGHQVDLFEADVTLLDRLRHFMPSDPATGTPTGIVFNMAYGIQGDCRYTHVPAMLEMAGIPYTGSSPMGHTLALDKVITKTLLRAAGVPTPHWLVASCGEVDPDRLRLPLIVKPRHESTSFGLRLVRNREELCRAVGAVLNDYSQEALVEEFIEGREVCIGLLGNGVPRCLPPVELDFGTRDCHAFTWEDKMHQRLDEPRKICPAELSPALQRRLRDISVATFQACHCRDYARVDIRIDSSGEPYVLEINSMASLGASASYVLASGAVGHSFSSLVCGIVDVAHRRYFGLPAPISRADGAEVLASIDSTATATGGQPSEFLAY